MSAACLVTMEYLAYRWRFSKQACTCFFLQVSSEKSFWRSSWSIPSVTGASARPNLPGSCCVTPITATGWGPIWQIGFYQNNHDSRDLVTTVVVHHHQMENFKFYFWKKSHCPSERVPRVQENLNPRTVKVLEMPELQLLWIENQAHFCLLVSMPEARTDKNLYKVNLSYFRFTTRISTELPSQIISQALELMIQIARAT